jgi:hypothetical protein
MEIPVKREKLFIFKKFPGFYMIKFAFLNEIH